MKRLLDRKEWVNLGFLNLSDTNTVEFHSNNEESWNANNDDI